MNHTSISTYQIHVLPQFFAQKTYIVCAVKTEAVNKGAIVNTSVVTTGATKESQISTISIVSFRRRPLKMFLIKT